MNDMPEDLDEKCFRCRGLKKVMLRMTIDGKSIRLCGSCYRDFTLFLEGYVVNPLVKFQEAQE